MKKLLSILLLSFFAFANISYSQQKVAVKWAPAGLFAGSFNLLGEFKLVKRIAITGKIGIPVSKAYTTTYDNNDANFNIKTTSFLAGARIYMSHKSFRGFYFEPYLKNVHHEDNGAGSGTLGGQPVIYNFIGDYKGTGIGVQTGVQWRFAKIVVIDFYFFGPEINTSKASFITKDVTNNLPWTVLQAQEAQQNASDFVNKIPIIGKNTTVTVDQNNKTVTCDYSGGLPGIRIGLAIGIII